MDPIPVRLSEDLQNRVDDLAKEMAISRSAVLRLAIKQWLNAVDVKGLNPLLDEEGRIKSSIARDPETNPPNKRKKRR